MNALLFSDDVISQKYHNKGNIDFITTMSLTIISNILSYILITIMTRLTNIAPILEILVQNKKRFDIKVTKIIKVIKIKFVLYYCFLMIITVFSLYYNSIFCEFIHQVHGIGSRIVLLVLGYHYLLPCLYVLLLLF